MRRMGWFKITGVDEFICLDEVSACGAFRDTNSDLLTKASLPQGKALYTAAGNMYYFNKIYFEADVLISIPVLKTHCFTSVTGAVKNVGIGATPVNIYGGSPNPGRGEIIDHSSSSNYSRLQDWIHDYYMCKPVDFAIMDALTGLQHGPSQVTYDPISQQKKNTRCIMASSDPIAMDAIESLIIMVDPSKVRHLVTLHNDSLGCADARYIKISGTRVDQVKDDFLHTASYALYNDLIPPSVSVNNYRFSSDSMFLDLNAGADVVKIEIAVDKVLLDPIYLNNYDNMIIKTGTIVTDPKQVMIYAYDQYLNCSIIHPDGSPFHVNSMNSKGSIIKVYPNPARDHVKIEFGKILQGETQIYLYDLNGRIAKRMMVSNSAACDLELSDLRMGEYILNINNRQMVEQVQIVKK
jgi:hypothetical protein